MRKIVLTLLLHTVLIVTAQNRQIDSLQEILRAAKPDSNRVNAFIALSKEYSSLSSYELSTLYAYKAKEMARSIKFLKGEISAYTIIGSAYFNKTEYADAYRTFDSALKICPAKGLDVQKHKLYFNMGNICYVQGQYHLALEKYFLCRDYFKKTKDIHGLSQCYNNIGNVYGSLENKNDKALENYTEALKLYKQSGDKNKLAETYVNLGTVHMNMGNFSEAMDYYNESFLIDQELGDGIGMAQIYINTGILFMKQEKFEDALGSYEEAERSLTELSNPYYLANAQSGMSVAFYNLKKYKKALEYGKKSLTNALETNNTECLKELYTTLSETEEKLDHYKNALLYYKQHIVLRDSLFGEETTRRMTELELKADFEKQSTLNKLNLEKSQTNLQADNKLKKMEVEQNKLIQLFIALTTVFVIFIVYLLIRLRKFRSLMPKKASKTEIMTPEMLKNSPKPVKL